MCDNRVECQGDEDEKFCSDVDDGLGLSNIILGATATCITLVYLGAKVGRYVSGKHPFKEEKDFEMTCKKVETEELLEELGNRYEDNEVIEKVNNFLFHILYSKTVDEKKIIFKQYFLAVAQVNDFDEEKVYNYLHHNIKPKLVDEMLESQYPGLTAKVIDLIEDLFGKRFIRNFQDLLTENDKMHMLYSIIKRTIKLIIKSIHKVKDIYIAVIVLVLVGGPSAIVNFYTKFTCVIVVILFLLIIVPDLMSSLHLAIKNPGIIFKKDRKYTGLKLYLLQAVNMMCFPINDTLLVDCYEVAKGKLINAAKQFCPQKIKKTLKYYRKVQKQWRAYVKINYEAHVYYMVVAHLFLLNLGRTETPTTAGLNAAFHRETTIFGIHFSPEILLYLSIWWSLFSSLRLRLYSIYSQKQLFRTKSQGLAFCWILFGSLRKTLMMTVFFAPSSGFYNILHHWKMEQIPFKSRLNYAEKFGITAEDKIELYGLNKTIFWRELDRWNYSDPVYPTAPDYNYYTGLTLQESFLAFFILLVLHFIAILVAKWATARQFNDGKRKLEKCFHILENMNIPNPFIDWDVTEIGPMGPFRSTKNYKKQFR